MNMRLVAILAGSSLVALNAASPAFAQSEDETGEIVVTGTYIRGVAPTGANVIGVSEAAIEATGATDTNQLLGTIPQAGNFFNNDNVAAGGGNIGGNSRSSINRPNIRNLPGGDTSTGAQTLIMIDGHRVIGTGIGILAVDAEIMPPGAMQRVEVMTDGVSSIYGSDAIGGIINFITRSDFDGIEVGGNYGIADNYEQWSGNLTAGTGWANGSGLFSYNYAYHDPLFGRDRDFIQRINWATGIPTGRNCIDSQITRSSNSTAVYAGSDPFTATTPAAVNCDETDHATYSAETERQNFFFRVDQDITTTLNFGVTGLFSHREDINYYGALRPDVATGAISVVVPNTNYYRNALGIPAGETVRAFFNYGSVLGNRSQTGLTTNESWQITPTLTWDISETWQIRALAAYGKSTSEFANRLPNTTLQTAALASSDPNTALNPFDISATNPSVIASIDSFTDRGESENQLTNYRVIADGELFDLPGGTIRLAAGAEYIENDYAQRLTNQVTRALNPWGSFAQTIDSQFVELSVPIVGEGNRVPGIERLTLSLSGRRDDYNDRGETTNPRIGITYEPVDWIEVRSSWGTSFNAPTPPDTISTLVGPRIRVIPAQVPPGVTVPPPPTGFSNVTLIMDQGAPPDLMPQESENWGIGINVRPPVLPGLMFDLSYYNISIDGIIGSPATGSIANLYATYGTRFFDIDVTPAEIAATLATNPTTGPSIATSLATNNQQVVTILDNRARNLGLVELDGVDFVVSYEHDTSWGSWDVRLGGNYQLTRDSTIGGATTDTLAFASTLRASLSVGATIGDLRGQVTFNHSGGYDLAPSTTLFNQTEVDDFNVVNAFFRYDFETIGKGASLTLNVNNVFDEEPPVFQDSGTLSNGYANGFTIGRLFQVGFTQRF